MIKHLKPKSEFGRNVLTLMTGTTIAQAIPIAISPILTRIYTPEDFGVFALIMGISTIISVAATGRYEHAIMLPKKIGEAVNIVVLSILLVIFVSIAALLGIMIFNVEITALLGSPEISKLLYFVPCSIFLTGMYRSFSYWSIRKKQYKALAFNRVSQTGTTAVTNVTLGMGGLGNIGLLWGTLAGQGVATIRLGAIILRNDRASFNKVQKSKIYILAKRYVNFPKFDILASLLNVGSQQIVPILFNLLFSSLMAGYYFFVVKILNLPAMIVSRAVSDVFKEKASKDYNELGSAKVIYLLTLKRLFLIGVFPAIAAFFFIADLFVIIFGHNWIISGQFAQILIPMIFLRFVVSPLTYIFYIASKQNINLIGQFFLFAFTLLSFYCGYEASDPFITVTLISVLYSMFYIVNLYLSYRLCDVNS